MSRSSARENHPSPQIFGKVDQALDLSIPQSGVRRDANGIVDEGIRGHLATSLRTPPCSSRLDQRPPDPLAPHVGIDVPAFDVPARPRFGPLGVGANARLEKAAQ